MAGVAKGSKTDLPGVVILRVREYLAFSLSNRDRDGSRFEAIGFSDRMSTEPETQTRVTPEAADVKHDLGEAESINALLGKGYVQKGEARESVSSFRLGDEWCMKTRDVTYQFERPTTSKST